MLLFLEEQKRVVVAILKSDKKVVSEKEKRGGDRYEKMSGNKNLIEREGMTEGWHAKEFIPGLWYERAMSKLLRKDFQKK